MERNVMKTVLELMALAARTAPKGKGEDFVVMLGLDGEDLQELGRAMIRYGEQNNDDKFIRDGNNVLDSMGLLLIGLKNAPPLGLNCGGCGEALCADLNPRQGPQFLGPICVIRMLDLGIAIGSAVKTAGILNVDNRVMYRAGAVAVLEKIIDADIAIGIPVSATGKSPYFDR